MDISSRPLVPPRAVTIYTNTGPKPAKDGSQLLDNTLFVGQRFQHAERDNIGGYLRRRLDDSTIRNRVLIITSEPWLLETLHSEFNGFPQDLFSYLNVDRGHGPSTAVRPSYDDENKATHSQTEQHVPTMDFEDRIIAIHGMAALIMSASRLDQRKTANEPIIILYLANRGLLPRLDRYLGVPDNVWRMNRLLHCPVWIYMDLFQACGDWSGVWDVVRRDLARRDVQAYQDLLRPSTLHLTRRLHRATSNVITLREDLRLHIASFKRVQVHIKNNTLGPWPSSAPFKATLDERAADILEDLNHHWETSGVVLQQYNSLLSLVFNTETVTQGQAVARLNMLAFAFLPLSFVAGIFGMSTFSVSAVWYPLWAFVVFAIVVFAAYIASKLSGNSEDGQCSALRECFNLRFQKASPLHTPSDNNQCSGTAIVPVATGLAPQMPPPNRRWDTVRNRRNTQHAQRREEHEEHLKQTKSPSDGAQDPPTPSPAPQLHVRGQTIDSVSDYEKQPPDSSSEEDLDGNNHIASLPAVVERRRHVLTEEDLLDLRGGNIERQQRMKSQGERKVQRGVTLVYGPYSDI
ncbi:hypothetical protein BJY04DRAFT_208361 [Aspergillus karnatakaensis]|uniref:uncharacterized protein n=1 Tax=Aspergillus karnatakaensis TaxID=1810916 RepID=UPI003CCD66AD